MEAVMRVARAMSRASLFFVAAIGAAACQQGQEPPGSGQQQQQQQEATQHPEAAAQERETELHGILDVSGPEGWARASEPAGVRWTSPGNDVQLFFGPLHAGEDARTVLAGLATRWGLRDVRWTDEQNVFIGADRFPAHAADAACKTASGEATIAYATAEIGRGTVLVAYVFGAGASAETREAAMKIVGSFKKK